VICYTGIGARKNGTHRISNFRKVTRKLYSKSKCKSMKRDKKKFGFGSECPKNTNNKGWVDFFGAEYTTRKKCSSIMKNNRLLNKSRRSNAQEQARG